jgi:hypothetical protein
MNRMQMITTLVAAMMVLAIGNAQARADIIWAGTNFVDLDATALPAGPLTTWSNAGTLGDFTAMNGPVVMDIDGANAVMLDGVDDYFAGPLAVTGLEGSSDCSIEVWAQNSWIAGEETLVAWSHRGGGDGTNMSFNYGSHDTWGAVGHWGPPDLGWNGAPKRDQWHHLVYTYDGTTQRVYADGVEKNFEDVGALAVHAGDPILVGSQNPAVAVPASLSIGKVRVHDGVLSPADVLNNYNEEKALFPVEPEVPPQPEQIPAGPIHRWSFSETGGAGTMLVDSIGGANGTIVDVGANDGTVGGGQVTLAGGGKDVSDYVDLPDGLVSGLVDATIETWATQETVQNWSRIFDFGADTENYLFMSWTMGTDINADRAGLRVGVEYPIDNAMAPYTLEEEFHIVMTIDDDGGPGDMTQIKLYKDGVLMGGQDTPYDLSELLDTNNWLGRSQWGDNTANASWNEFRIYDYALTDNQLLGNYEAGPDELNVIPEPGSIVLLVMGLIGLAVWTRRKK